MNSQTINPASGDKFNQNKTDQMTYGDSVSGLVYSWKCGPTSFYTVKQLEKKQLKFTLQINCRPGLAIHMHSNNHKLNHWFELLIYLQSVKP